jgi:hypothetical protein
MPTILRITTLALLGSTLIAGVAAIAARTVAPRGARLTGVLEAVWVCGEHAAHAGAPGTAGHVEFSLGRPGRRPVPLDLSRAGLPSATAQELIGQPVTVTGQMVRLDAAGTEGLAATEVWPAAGMLDVARSKDPLLDAEALGPKPYVVILCRFADTRNVASKSTSFFTGLFGSATPGLNNYYTAISGGKVFLTADQFVEAVDLPLTRNDYRLPDGSFDRDRALRDAIAAVDDRVDFTRFYGIALAFNVRPFPGNLVGVGGRRFLTLDGQTRTWGVVWTGDHEQAIWAHELGHSLSLPHSSGPYDAVSDSRWDMMSNPFARPDNRFVQVAQSTIGYHFDLLGWIDAARKRTVEPRSQVDVDLDALSTPTAGAGPLLVRIPLPGDGRRFYTAEARRRVGFDAGIPADGVVLHLVDTNRGDRQAQVVDETRNNNPNDAGAVWLPGETFTDPVNGVQVIVAAATSTGFRILASRDLLAPTSLTARPVGSADVALNWVDNSRDETGFLVERRTGGAAFTTVANLPANTNTFTDRGVPQGATLTYRVTMVAAGNATAHSAEVTVTAGGGFAGRLSVPRVVNFGKVKVRKVATRNLVVKNLDGRRPLQVRLFGLVAPFSLPGEPLTLVIAPRKSRSVKVRFAPTARGSFRASINVESSDPGRPLATVSAVGNGN